MMELNRPLLKVVDSRLVFNTETEFKTETETLGTGAYLRLKKRKTIIWKKLEIFEVLIFKKSRIVPKNVKGGPFWIY